jgi:hypothetical protein
VAAKTEESSEERREGTTATNEAKSKTAKEEVEIAKGRQYL